MDDRPLPSSLAVLGRNRLGLHAADEAVAVPLREGLGAAIEHEIAGRDHRDPVDRRFRQVGPGVGS